jgi:hypothetical protein
MLMKHGPVDVIALAFGEPRFDGNILVELENQAASGTIRVLDAMVLFKDGDGECWRLDLEDLPPDEAASLGFIETGTRGLFHSDDADTLWEGMVPGSAVLALAIEHAWAVDLVNALDAQGVEVALNFRVPAPIVDEAFASLTSDS